MVDQELVERVKLGNDKLIAAWNQVKNFQDDEIYEKGVDKLKEASTKLHHLNLALRRSQLHGTTQSRMDNVRYLTG